MADFLERRAFDRVQVRFEVTVVGPAGRQVVEATDVSVGGMRVEASPGPESARTAATKVLFPGAMVSVEFATHDDAQVQVFARVRWLEKDRAGLGLEFLDPAPEARTAISSFVAALKGGGR